MVTEVEVNIPMPDGIADSIVIEPENQEARPGVLCLTDVGGIRPASLSVARHLAEHGYTVLVPNLFYRLSRTPVFKLPPGASAEERMQRIHQLIASLPPSSMEQDAESYLNFLRSRPSVKRSSLGVVGYCFSGGFAMRAAAAFPDVVAAAASFHGGGLYTENPDSPHHLLPRIKASLYFGHAVNDRSMPEEAIGKFNAALQEWGGNYISEVYEGAYHSWTMPDSPVYNEPQARVALEALLALFARTIG